MNHFPLENNAFFSSSSVTHMFSNSCCRCNWRELESFLNQTSLFCFNSVVPFLNTAGAAVTAWFLEYYGWILLQLSILKHLFPVRLQHHACNLFSVNSGSNISLQHNSETFFTRNSLCVCTETVADRAVAPLCFMSLFKGITLYFYQRHEYLCRTFPFSSKRYFLPEPSKWGKKKFSIYSMTSRGIPLIWDSCYSSKCFIYLKKTLTLEKNKDYRIYILRQSVFNKYL